MPDTNMRGNYNFRIELKDEVYFVGTDWCLETNGWIRSLHRIKETMEENNRSKFDRIKRNIDKFILLYRQKRGDEIKNMTKQDYGQFFDNFDKNSAGVDDFIDISLKAQEFLDIVIFY